MKLVFFDQNGFEAEVARHVKEVEQTMGEDSLQNIQLHRIVGITLLDWPEVIDC